MLEIARFETGNHSFRDQGNKFHSHSPSHSYNKMPVDFAAYLLSSSPPIGFSNIAEHFCDEESLKTYCNNFPSSRSQRTGPLKSIINIRAEMPQMLDLDLEQSVDCNHVDEDLLDDFSDLCSFSDKTLCETASDSVVKNKINKKKKVVFADALGFALAKVKILTEASDVPPVLRPNLISALTQGATADVIETPPLKLNFCQPASDYVNFRKKVDMLNVSLENVILLDYSIEGTIRVKNISFEKRVFVRVSYDSWETFTDIEGCFCQNFDNASCNYDTFKFHINVPSRLDIKAQIEFCVCFDSIGTGSQYWDSNDGKNYQVVSTAEDNAPPPAHYTQDYKPNFEGISSFTTYKCWSNTDDSPYY